jgi:hypothetical protein
MSAGSSSMGKCHLQLLHIYRSKVTERGVKVTDLMEDYVLVTRKYMYVEAARITWGYSLQMLNP